MPGNIDNLQEFLKIFPLNLCNALKDQDLERLIEVVLDYGRPAEARYLDQVRRMDDILVTKEDISVVIKAVGDFGKDNRAGIERTLHRISCIRNRRGEIIGLTCRVGRPLEGTIDIMDDVVRSGKSILLLGKPGIGKTTKLREIARVLADEVKKRVVIIDTSNEIGGDGDVPHPSIGSARRMQVSEPAHQHAVMIEAVENHMPEVIVIDEIGTAQEAFAARTIAERGVQLIGTAHGQTLENLMLNPTLSDLVGGIQAVTLSDDEAKRRGTQKTVLERMAPSTFDVVVELIDYDQIAVHPYVERVVDSILRGHPARPQVRIRTDTGKLEVVQEAFSAQDFLHPPAPLQNSSPQNIVLDSKDTHSDVKSSSKQESVIHKMDSNAQKSQKVQDLLKIYPYGIARTRLERAIRELKAPVYLCNDMSQADAVIVMRSTYHSQPAKLRELRRFVRVVPVKSNAYGQILAALKQVLQGPPEDLEVGEKMMSEVLKGIEQVEQTGRAVDLSPQDARMRKIQHQLIETRNFASESVGREPDRYVRILPVQIKQKE